VKKILACAFVVKAHVVGAILFARACKSFVAQRRSRTSGVAKNPYFIASFVCSVRRTQSCAKHLSRTMSYRAFAMLATLRDALRGADTRFVKSKAVFFIAL
jgi:hypothetical protein